VGQLGARELPRKEPRPSRDVVCRPEVDCAPSAVHWVPLMSAMLSDSAENSL
jgi:hypothetical protein